MPYRRKYRPRYRRRRYRRRRGAASVIQRAFRRRRVKNRMYRSKKRFAVRKFNHARAEMTTKSFTIVCPDQQLLSVRAGLLNQGISCTDTGADEYSNCIRFGLFLRDTTQANDVAIFSDEVKNYLELYKQVRILHGSVTLLKYSNGIVDGNTPSSNPTPPGPNANNSIGGSGNKTWVSYMHSVVDNGQFKATSDLQNLQIQPSSLIATQNPDEYFANSNAKFQQLSWDNKKSCHFKIIKPSKNSDWLSQPFGLFDNSLPPKSVGNYFTDFPWLPTRQVENVSKNLYAATNPNYQSVFALGMLPPLSTYGTSFPGIYNSVGGLQTPVPCPIHKVLLSITLQFRTPTTRN